MEGGAHEDQWLSIPHSGHRLDSWLGRDLRLRASHVASVGGHCAETSPTRHPQTRSDAMCAARHSLEKQAARSGWNEDSELRRKVYSGWSYVLLWQSCDLSTMAFEKYLEEIGF